MDARERRWAQVKNRTLVQQKLESPESYYWSKLKEGIPVIAVAIFAAALAGLLTEIF